MAMVQLPEWFETLNKDFRYQLTALGTPQAGLFISKEIENGRFTIAGGVPRGTRLMAGDGSPAGPLGRLSRGVGPGG
jgi:hypothetical protein